MWMEPEEFKPEHAQADREIQLRLDSNPPAHPWQACSGRNAEQQQMQQFVDKNVAAFQELKDGIPHAG